MEALLAILAILGAIAVGMVSPGPSVLFVARLSAESGARSGLAAALGMGLGGLLFAVLAMAGLTALIAKAPLLYLGFKIGGGAYLIYLGWRLWRGARAPMRLASTETRRATSSRRAFLLALAVQVSNPKTAVVYASVFAALLPATVSPLLAMALPLALFVMETGWYTLLALGFSRSGLRTRYARAKAWIDRGAGGVMALLGLRLMADGILTREAP